MLHEKCEITTPLDSIRPLKDQEKWMNEKKYSIMMIALANKHKLVKSWVVGKFWGWKTDWKLSVDDDERTK